jgi:hypothetical protein
MSTIIATNKTVKLLKENSGSDKEKNRLYASINAGVSIPKTRINNIHLKIKVKSFGTELPKLIRVYYFDSPSRYQSEVISINGKKGSLELEVQAYPHESKFFNEAFFVNKIGFSSEGAIDSDVEMNLEVEKEL